MAVLEVVGRSLTMGLRRRQLGTVGAVELA
jgi:hypothetical protein